MKTAIQAELPDELVAEARAFVEQGSVGDFNELLAEALCRRLLCAMPAMTEQTPEELKGTANE
jgi:hypothetical protein